MLELAVLTVLPGAVAFAAAFDLLTLRIPNLLSLLMVLAFFPLAVLGGMDAADMAGHVGTGLLMLVVGLLLFIPGWFGGGDAKLMAAVGLWIGPENLLLYLFWVAIAGGVLAAMFFTIRAVPLPPMLRSEPWAVRLHRRDGGIPYGLALAAGALLVYPQTAWFTGLAG
jgi:prepilin peptidase CpaA